MKNFMKIASAIIATSLVSACGINPEVYIDKNPRFIFEQFFLGDLCARGILRNSNDQLTRTFVADIEAKKNDGVITLDENFLFDDGERQERLWRFVEKDKHYIGTAGDVVGEAIGKSWGNSFNLKYDLEVKTDSNSWILDMDDWLHLVDQNTLVGVTDMKKFGFSVGQIVIVIQKLKDNKECNASK